VSSVSSPRRFRSLWFVEVNVIVGLLVAGALIGPVGPAAAQDVSAGEAVFRQCSICHSIGPGAKNKIGPELNGLDGRRSASVANFNYSDAEKKSGIVWSEATFKQYIADPRAMIADSKMIFAGLKDPQQISDLWAYLAQFSVDGSKR
jgi:cytochrome c